MRQPRRPHRWSDAPSASRLSLPEAEHQGQRRHNPVVSGRGHVSDHADDVDGMSAFESRRLDAPAIVLATQQRRQTAMIA